jgi:LysM repeat protein
MKFRVRLSPRVTTIALGVAAAPLFVLGVSACGGDVGGTATTVVPIPPTDFATIPPVITTAPQSNTTLPPGSVGVEQNYVVELGDSPIKIATLYGISVEELLMYNGWVSVTQFPYPGQSLRIPPTAKATTDQAMSQTTLTPQGAAGQGCGSRPAGTYEVQTGDSLSLIGSKFCVKIAALMAANGWMDSAAVQLFAGQSIVIPAVGQ